MKKKGSPADRLRLSRFKLDALLDITLSINANLPREDLLSKYESILRSNLGIGKILIFKRSVKWECILNGGFPHGYDTGINVETDLLKYHRTAIRDDITGMEGVEIIIPVFNNSVPLAFILIGDIEEEGEGVSPVIKHLNFVQTISSIILVAIENQRLFKENLRQEGIKKELELAAAMQQKLIPDNRLLPHGEKLSVKGFYYPHYEVGGDYYDCIQLSESTIGFCIADVAGKGISAAILMSNFQAGLRAIFTAGIKLPELISTLNTLIVANASGDRFITFFVARYNIMSGVLEYVNAGHNPPVLYNAKNGGIIHLGSTCVGIGMLDEIPPVKEETVKINNHTKIVCYTDGLSDLKGIDGKEILTREIIRYISNSEPIEKNIQLMLDSLGIPDKNPDLFDDVSLLAIEIKK